MSTHLAIALAGALLVASPGAGAAPLDGTPQTGEIPPDEMQPPQSDGGQQGTRLTEAQAFSAIAGQVVGAASVCQGISKARITKAVGKASAVASAVAADDDELTSASELFTAGTQIGKAAVRRGNANCDLIDSSLARLERLDVR
jgi:hypothetical protein